MFAKYIGEANNVGDDDAQSNPTPSHQPTPGFLMTCTLEPTEDIAIGDGIECKIEVQNELEVSITNVAITGNPGAQELSIQSIAAGETKTVTYYYTVTQANADAGEVKIEINAEGKTADPNNSVVYSQATATATMEDADAKLSITKTADVTRDIAEGDVITYTVIVKNEGNVSINSGSLSDDHANLSGRTFSLAPGKTAEFTYTYTVSQHDVDVGQVVNVVRANASAVRGDAPEEVQATATITMEDADAKLSITTTGSPTQRVNIGDTITYTTVVRNTGNVTVTNGTLVDDHADLSSRTFSLAPGETAEFTYNYTVTSSDASYGSVVNIVKANATAVRGDDPAEVAATSTVICNGYDGRK